MQQFFAEPSWIRENKIFMQGSDVNHIRNVLRMKPGEDVRVNDGRGKTYLCCISSYEEQTAVLDILKEQKAGRQSGGIYHKTQIELTYNSNHMDREVYQRTSSDFEKWNKRFQKRMVHGWRL